jgi:hypothetical protein
VGRLVCLNNYVWVRRQNIKATRKMVDDPINVVVVSMDHEDQGAQLLTTVLRGELRMSRLTGFAQGRSKRSLY